MKGSIISILSLVSAILAAPIDSYHVHHQHKDAKVDIVTKTVYVNGKGQLITPGGESVPITSLSTHSISSSMSSMSSRSFGSSSSFSSSSSYTTPSSSYIPSSSLSTPSSSLYTSSSSSVPLYTSYTHSSSTSSTHPYTSYTSSTPSFSLSSFKLSTPSSSFAHTTLATSRVLPSDIPSENNSNSNNHKGSTVDGDLSLFQFPSSKFEDGKYKCSSVPGGQGVIKVDWVSGLNGGWTTIMDKNGKTSPNCVDGFYCSYACQAGMSKTQWPSEQPANGISVGGLYCKNGYLYRSNPNKEHLCEWGENTAHFVSEINKNVALCRTDYPGSENMIVPTLLSAGDTMPVSVVNSNNYYTWRGGKTSTQYYVNDAGVSVQDGCLWGNEGSGVGNWAPVVLGAGSIDGKTYLSLIPNPNNRNPPNYNIKIVGEPGAIVHGNCKYENGIYNGDKVDGCTVTITSGKAKFVFY